jgi:hypothetical protein
VSAQWKQVEAGDYQAFLTPKGWELYDGGDFLVALGDVPEAALAACAGAYSQGHKHGTNHGRNAAFFELRRLIGAAQ